MSAPHRLQILPLLGGLALLLSSAANLHCSSATPGFLPLEQARGSHRQTLLLAPGKRPPWPYVETGVVQIRAFGDKSKPSALARALRKHARDRGCDAVLETRTQNVDALGHGIGICVVEAMGERE